MPFGAGPPKDAREWPFACLLEFCLVNGVGLASSASGTRWTAVSLAHSSGNFSNKAVEAWTQSVNLPDDPLFQHLLDALTDNEPSRFRTPWRRALTGSLKATKNVDAANWKQRSEQFRETIKARLQITKPFRMSIRILGDAIKKRDDQVISKLEKRRARLRSLDAGPQRESLNLLQNGRETRIEGDLSGALQVLNGSLALLEPELDVGYNLMSLYARARAERGQVYFDMGHYIDATEEFFRANMYLPREQTFEFRAFSKQFWYSFNNAFRKSSDFSAAKKFYRKARRVEIQEDAIALTIMIGLAPSPDDASPYFDRYLKEKFEIGGKFVSNVVAAFCDSDRLEEILNTLTTKGWQLNYDNYVSWMNATTNYKYCRAVFDRMMKAELPVGQLPFGLLLNRAKNADTVSELETEMLEHKVVHNSYTAGAILEHIPEFSDALVRLRAFCDAKIELAAEAFNIVIRKSDKLSDYVAAVDLITKNGASPDLSTYQAMLVSCKFYETALKVMMHFSIDERLVTPKEVSIWMINAESFENAKATFDRFRHVTKQETAGYCHHILLDKATTDSDRASVIALKRADGLPVSVYEYGILMKTISGFDQGSNLISEMDKANLKQNAVILNNFYKNMKSPIDRQKVVDLFDIYKIRPDQFSFAMRVTRSTNFVEVLEICRVMAGHGVKPNHIVEDRIHDKAQNLDDWRAYAALAKASGFTIFRKSDFEVN